MNEPKIITPLRVEQVDENDWVTLKDFRYYSAVLGRELVVPEGFVTDFASVPRLPFVYFLTGGVAVRAAVVHDYLYRSRSAPRAQADAVFLEVMKLTGQPWWRRRLMWLGVRAFGRAPYNQEHNPVHSGVGNVAANDLPVVPPTPAPAAIESAKDPGAPHSQLESKG